MPEKLATWLGSLNDADANAVDEWLDSEPDAIEKMREITFPRTTEGQESMDEEDDK